VTVQQQGSGSPWTHQFNGPEEDGNLVAATTNRNGHTLRVEHNGNSWQHENTVPQENGTTYASDGYQTPEHAKAAAEYYSDRVANV
jgi:hypothetical protein